MNFLEQQVATLSEDEREFFMKMCSDTRLISKDYDPLKELMIKPLKVRIREEMFK